MSNLVRLSSISFETTKYHFPGAKDKVDLVGLLFSISLDNEFAALPPQRATRSISSDFYSRFCSTDVRIHRQRPRQRRRHPPKEEEEHRTIAFVATLPVRREEEKNNAKGEAAGQGRMSADSVHAKNGRRWLHRVFDRGLSRRRSHDGVD